MSSFGTNTNPAFSLLVVSVTFFFGSSKRITSSFSKEVQVLQCFNCQPIFIPLSSLIKKLL
jgi:hypothetical protein